jgi:hypothetical protein
MDAPEGPPVEQVAAAESEASAVVWAGHQVTVTTRKVPFLGDIETRQDVDMIATVHETAGVYTLVETPCRIAIASDGGVDLAFDEASVRNIPASTITLAPTESGLAGSWTGGWGELDVDGDGKPGFKVRVHAPICGGSMEVATTTAGVGAATPVDGGGLDGTVDLTLNREILQTSNLCLGLVPSQSSELVHGTFEYRPVAADSTCDSLIAAGWPVVIP